MKEHIPITLLLMTVIVCSFGCSPEPEPIRDVTCQGFTYRDYMYLGEGPVGEQTTWGDLEFIGEYLACNGICAGGEPCQRKDKLVEVTLPNGIKVIERHSWCGCENDEPSYCHILLKERRTELGEESYRDTTCEGDCPSGECTMVRRYLFRQPEEAYTKQMLESIKGQKVFDFKTLSDEGVEVRVIKQCECL